MQINDTERQFKNATINLPDDKNFFVIVGANNSGKSTFLRSVIKTFPTNSYRIDVNRTILRGEGSRDKNYTVNYQSYLNQTADSKDDNYEKPLQVLQDFFNLKNKDRTPILDWYNKYFPNNIYEEREDTENDASSMFLKVGGHPITKQGSGIRSTLEIFVKLFDSSIKILCIDEAELGLEPILQKFLFQAIKEKASAEKKIILATHSHHFLDYDDVQNNFICERDSDGKITLTESTDLKPIIFRLLGNTLSSYLLPEKILILEGSSDNTFIKQCLNLLGKNNYAIHSSGGDGNIGYAVGAITQFLRFNDALPVYQENIFVIVDKPTRDGVIRQWRNLLRSDNRLKVLSENGIEYFYPENILKIIFNTTANRETIVSEYLRANPCSFNNISLTKNQLSKKVSEMLELDSLNEEGNELFEFIKSLP